MVEVLRLHRPANKCPYKPSHWPYAVRDQRTKGLGDPLTGAPSAKEFGKRCCSETVHRNCDEESEHRQALAEVDVWDLLHETKVPTRRRPLELLRFTVGE
jgi:hypothetical protein